MKNSVLQPKTHVESYMFPALFAFGVLLGTFAYFSLSFEVSVTLCALLSISLLVCLWFTLRFYRLSILIILAFSVFLGLTNTAYQVQTKQPYFLGEKYDAQRFWVVGQIAKQASFDGRDKVTLENVKVYGVEGRSPKKVRVSSTVGRFADFGIGDWVSAEVMLHTPSHPRFDGDFNFRRYAWLNEVGATGYVMGQIHQTSWPEGFVNNSYKIQKARKALTQEVVNADDEGGVTATRAVMAALLTGKRTYIEDEIYDAYRSSGLAHLLAISGLHIGLVGGFVYFVIRRLFGLSEYITLRYNTKVPASILAIVACVCYTVLAGGTLPTLRALFMASLIFIGFIFGRLHNTMRILMLTLAIVLLLWPESLLTASFQMSFAAVFALTLWNEFRESELYSHLRIVRGMTYTKGVFLTSVVAGLATMPVAAWHFGEIHFVGFLVNVLAIPITAFVVMPFALLGVVLLPVGLSGGPFYVMGQGVGWLNAIALWGQALPVGHYVIEKGEVAYLCIGVLLCLLTLYVNRFKKLSFTFLCVFVGLSVFTSTQSRDFLWLDYGRTVLAPVGAGAYQPLIEGDDKRLMGRFKLNASTCGEEYCYVNTEPSVLALSSGFAPMYEDCLQADYVLGEYAHFCPNAVQVDKGVQSGRLVFKNEGVLFMPDPIDENRIWY